MELVKEPQELDFIIESDFHFCLSVIKFSFSFSFLPSRVLSGLWLRLR